MYLQLCREGIENSTSYHYISKSLGITGNTKLPYRVHNVSVAIAITIFAQIKN